MRWTLRGVRITYSPRSCVAVRVYCSSESVSLPSFTTNAPESCTTIVLAGVCHRQRAGDMLVGVLLRLALDHVAGATRADRSLAGFGVRIAALDHEVRDHAMEFRPVVKA